VVQLFIFRFSLNITLFCTIIFLFIKFLSKKMKNIFNKKTLVMATALCMLVVISCKDSFLDVKPTGQLAQAQLSSKAGLEGALIGAYALMSGTGGNSYSRLASSSNWVFGSILGSDANKGTNAGDYSAINEIQRYASLPTNGDISSSYKARYEGIARCNSVLNLLKTAEADVSAADKTRIAAEARFLRAHYYFELKRIFNNTPYVDEATDETKIGAVGNGVELWGKIEADMKSAYAELPASGGGAGRANKWAAGAYLGKIYMYQKKFADAKTVFDAVIKDGVTANGKKYGLVPKYAQVFNAANDNHEESVFAIQGAISTGSATNANGFDDLNYPYNTGSNGPGNCCGFFQPSMELGNSFRTDAAGLPLLDGSYNSAANALKTDQGLLTAAAFTPDAGNLDPRIDHSIGRRGIPYLDWQKHPGFDWIRDQAYAGPYSPKKFIYYKSQEGTFTDGSSWTRGYAAMNYCIIRFADVLLLAAEAEIEAGATDKAREYVNLVRTRAANADGFVKDGTANAAKYVITTYAAPWTDKAVARNAVRFERKLELSGEGHRFFDLVRWGIAEATLNAYLTQEGKVLTTALGGAKFTPNKSEYQPIPQDQIDLQTAAVLKQNPGY
jgi:starch-binding outer membrane protein, SusD/RagB family